MSDLLIKGMKMPKSCRDCIWIQRDRPAGKVYCTATDPWLDISRVLINSRHDCCPLIEVPPHGRLGDLDKLEKMFADIDSAPYSCFDGEEPFYSAEDAVHIIRLAPTIIPAEEGE